MFKLNVISFTDLSVYRTQTSSATLGYHPQANSKFNPNPEPKVGLGLVLKVG